MKDQERLFSALKMLTCDYDRQAAQHGDKIAFAATSLLLGQVAQVVGLDRPDFLELMAETFDTATEAAKEQAAEQEQST